jgi:transketolase
MTSPSSLRSRPPGGAQADAFLDAGALPTLHERYGLSTARIAASIKGWLG